MASYRDAEEAFVSYFLSKIGPSKESEAKRKMIFEQLKYLIEKALGKKTHNK